MASPNSELDSSKFIDIDLLWDFTDPAASEARFQALVSEGQTQLARTLGLQNRFDEGHAVLDQVEPTTDRVRVRVLLERGRLFNSGGDPAKARTLFKEAYNMASTCGEEALEVDAAHMIAIVAEREEAKGWNERALAKAASSDDPKARKWRASLLNNLGWTYHDEGDYAKALELFQDARDCREQNGQEREERIARWCIARCLRSLMRYEEALAMQRQILEETSGESEHVREEIAALEPLLAKKLTS